MFYNTLENHLIAKCVKTCVIIVGININSMKLISVKKVNEL